MSGAGGALLAATVKSPEDDVLTKDPTISFFKSSYAQHAKFCRESVELPVQGQMGADSVLYCDIAKAGDLLGRLWVRFEFPGIRHPRESSGACGRRGSCDSSVSSNAGSYSSRRGSSSSSSGSSSGHSEHHADKTRDPKHWVTWNNALAHVAAQSLSIEVAKNTVATEMGLWMEICDEHMVRAGQENNEIVGRYPDLESLWRASRQRQWRYAKPRFWFAENIDQVLPILAIHYSHVQLRIQVAPLANLYISSDGCIPHLMNSNRELAPHDIKVSVFADIYWLTDAERFHINKERHGYIITQVQYNGGHHIPKNNAGSITCKLPFQHPVYELVWVVQQEEHFKRKNYFEFSGPNNCDPIDTARLSLNNHDVDSVREARWYRLQEPSATHTNIPKKHIYNRSFALFPENTTQPSGHFTPGRMNDCSLHVQPTKGLGRSVLHVWAKNYNVVRVLKGLVGVAWS